MPSEISKKNGGTTAIANHAPMSMTPGSMKDGNPEDVILPRIHLFQGLQEEVERYDPNGVGHKPGTFIETLEFGAWDHREFCPVLGWHEWIKFFEPRGSGIEYRTRNKSEVPTEDLKFGSAPNGVGSAAIGFINYVVLFKDAPNDPVILSFKSTDMTVGKTLYTLQLRRLSLARQESKSKVKTGHITSNLYELGCIKKKNAKGQWFGKSIRPVGLPDEKLWGQVVSCYDALSEAIIAATDDEEGSDTPF